MSLEVGDLAVVGVPTLQGRPEDVFLEAGEVVEVLAVRPNPDIDSAYVYGRSSGLKQYVDLSALTPFDEVAADPGTKWGDLIDPEYIHDYVYEGDDK
ncbi:hypothetical protein A5630_25325 [Mycolicibacterium mucogenicum]|uniref:Uncharacterized protein n=1 Tax=Mycolicibacterium mucogenicum TaxID=56689 RepID=A0A1A3GWS0_MYCMU|nr:hypothetical protein [Mycolicibacterium mucogenicum]OBJ40275.1 hypothetical protein A5630_25325 [Mycolicibacterium mucogenicum]